MPDEARHDSPGPARPTATEYPLTLDDVSRLFDEAGLPAKSERCSAAAPPAVSLTSNSAYAPAFILIALRAAACKRALSARAQADLARWMSECE